MCVGTCTPPPPPFPTPQRLDWVSLFVTCHFFFPLYLPPSGCARARARQCVARAALRQPSRLPTRLGLGAAKARSPAVHRLMMCEGEEAEQIRTVVPRHEPPSDGAHAHAHAHTHKQQSRLRLTGPGFFFLFLGVCLFLFYYLQSR